jgi:hypothetical protein
MHDCNDRDPPVVRESGERRERMADALVLVRIDSARDVSDERVDDE